LAEVVRLQERTKVANQAWRFSPQMGEIPSENHGKKM
jgi:hypothetical protein